MARDDSLDSAELTRLTRQLVDTPSVSGDEEAVLAIIREALPQDLVVVHDHDTVLFVTTARHPGKPLVILAGHTDPVPIEDNLPSRMDDGVIHGRGTTDMKGALAVMLHLAQQLPHLGDLDLDVDLGFLFFGREELPPDANALLPALASCAELRSAALAILMEPTSNAVEAGCQGNLNLTLSYEGVAAHTSRPWQGLNAAHLAVVDLQEVATALPNEVDIDGLVFSEVSSITGVRGGVARNVVPARVEIDLNIRYAPIRTPEDMESACRLRFEREGVTVNVIGNAPPAPVMIDHPLVERLLQSGAGAPVPKQAWTNAADFAMYDVPAVNFGPGAPELAHRRDEHITVGALVESYAVLRRFLTGDAR